MDKKILDRMAIKAGVIFVFLQMLVKGISFIATPIYTRMMTTAQYEIRLNLNLEKKGIIMQFRVFRLCVIL